MRSLAYVVCKRTIDFTLAIVGLVVLSPVLLGVAVAIWLFDRQNPLYYQTRIGKGGRPFRFYKFRSMRSVQVTLTNVHQNDKTFKMKVDPRVTKIGRFIRKTSLDELPQLLNVLLGDMAVVGPRPPLPVEYARYSESDMVRLSVTPGITCIWQVSGRSDIPFDRQVEMDAEYIRTRSVLTDLALIAKTVPAVISGKGAY